MTPPAELALPHPSHTSRHRCALLSPRSEPSGANKCHAARARRPRRPDARVAAHMGSAPPLPRPFGMPLDKHSVYRIPEFDKDPTLSHRSTGWGARPGLEGRIDGEHSPERASHRYSPPIPFIGTCLSALDGQTAPPAPHTATPPPRPAPASRPVRKCPHPPPPCPDGRSSVTTRSIHVLLGPLPQTFPVFLARRAAGSLRAREGT